MISRGSFRTYVKIPFFQLGIKFACPEAKTTVSYICSFLVAIVMNLKERARYKYYVLKKPCKQRKYIWQYEKNPLNLNPTYFSCGLFNIVKHQENMIKEEEFCLPKHDDINKKTGYLLLDINNENFAWESRGEIIAIDYGDFNITSYNALNVRYIDYA